MSSGQETFQEFPCKSSSQRKIPFPRKKPLVGSNDTRERKRTVEGCTDHDPNEAIKRSRSSTEDLGTSARQDGSRDVQDNKDASSSGLPNVFGFGVGSHGWLEDGKDSCRRIRRKERAERLGLVGWEDWSEMDLGIYLDSSDLCRRRRKVHEKNLRPVVKVTDRPEGTLLRELPMTISLSDVEGKNGRMVHHVSFQGMWEYVVHAGRPPSGVPELPLQPLQDSSRNRQQLQRLGELLIPRKHGHLLLELCTIGSHGLGKKKYRFSDFKAWKTPSSMSHNAVSTIEGREVDNPDMRIIVEAKEIGSQTHVGISSIVLIWHSKVAG